MKTCYVNSSIANEEIGSLYKVYFVFVSGVLCIKCLLFKSLSGYYYYNFIYLFETNYLPTDL